MATTVVVLHHVSWHGLYFLAGLFVGAGPRPQLELKFNYALLQLRIISTTHHFNYLENSVYVFLRMLDALH